MTFKLPPLPFAKDALEPHISAETIEYHYEKHHRGYVEKLNKLVHGTKMDGSTLEDLVRKAGGKVFNNAAQTWNHTFFWHCLTPNSNTEPSSAVKHLIETKFSTMDAFKEQFTKRALDLFGSGWVWLSLNAGGKLVLESLANAGNPMRSGRFPLLTLDVWEHAYYVDYRNDRAKFIAAFWQCVNWQFVADNLRKAPGLKARQTTRESRVMPQTSPG